MSESFLAMHMANELLTAKVAAVTVLVAAVAVVVSAWRARRGVDSEKLPLMGVMGAFVFAAQMINFTLPGMPGTSGHLGGGVLLAILLGPSGGILTMTAILIIQCLLFQDGGLLAIGCNIINMAIVPCLLGWTVYRVVQGGAKQGASWRLYLASWLGCLVGVTAGAALVPVEAAVSGVLKVPFVDFLLVMVGVHVIISLMEGLITFAVIAWLRRVRPAVMGLPMPADPQDRGRLGRKTLAVSMIVTSLVVAGLLSGLASQHPDGLEWSYGVHKYKGVEKAVVNDSPIVASVETAQRKWSPMPDYTVRRSPLGQVDGGEESDEVGGESRWPNLDGWSSLAGVVGTLITLGVVYLLALAVRKKEVHDKAVGG